MARALLFKLGLIGALLLVLLLPLASLRGLVLERQQRALEVAEEIAASSSREQLLVGPLLLIEATRTVRREHLVTEQGNMRSAVETKRLPVRVLVAPERLDVDAELATERRGRGVFTALLYHGEHRIAARFRLPPPPPADPEQIDYRVDAVKLLLGLGDSRGVRGVGIEVDGRALTAEPGSAGVAWLPEGLHAVLPDDLAGADGLEVSLRLDLSGTRQIGFVPLGDETHLSLRGDWPHPGFSGAHLPIERSLDAAGFSARWQVSRLSSRAQQAVQDCGTASVCHALSQTAALLRLVDPVDRYLMSERALKYALLLLVLVFGAVFFVEALRGIVVHPLQYGLTGLALAVFFLLLLALSEHIGFGPAYLVAAVACVALIAVYMAAVLGGNARGLAFAVLLGLLYALLYGLLQSEDYALLLGAASLFGLLAAVMLATRRLDWSRVGRGVTEPSPYGRRHAAEE